MADAADTGISGRAFGIGVVLLAVGLGAVIWFAIPGPDAKHRFVSPSGRVALELGEMCREAGCQRVAISEETAADGSKRRLGCEVPLTETHPVLLNAYPLWAADEASVDVVYADAEGVGGKFTLDLARDCTIEG
jgi:hypothetical protein